MHLQFSGDGTYTRTEARLLVCDDGRPDVPSSGVIYGTYEYKGLVLVLNADLGGGFSERSAAQFGNSSLTIYHQEVYRDGTVGNVTDTQLVFVATP